MLDFQLGSNHNSPIERSASKLTLETQKNLVSENSMYLAPHSVYEKVTQNTKSYTATAKPVWKTQLNS